MELSWHGEQRMVSQALLYGASRFVPGSKWPKMDIPEATGGVISPLLVIAFLLMNGWRVGMEGRGPTKILDHAAPKAGLGNKC